MNDISDRLGSFFEQNGLPRLAGRTMGHLLICVPPERTFDQLVDALAASRSSVSVATQLLLRLNFIERFSVPGKRRDRYRLAPDAWAAMLRQDLAAARELKQIASRGLSSSPARRSTAHLARLREMREFYTFLEGSLSPLLDAWEHRRRKRRPS